MGRCVDLLMYVVDVWLALRELLLLRCAPRALAAGPGALLGPELNKLESHRSHTLLSKSLGHQHWVYTSLGRSCAVASLTPPTRTEG